MVALKDTKSSETPRDVLRGVNSQIPNEIGVHWLRISFPSKYLSQVRSYCSLYFGDSFQDGYGLWSYDTRYSWSDGASLNYDSDPDRCALVHAGKATLDVPGKALDTIAQDRLHFFLIGLRHFAPSCTRCDVFFDDYRRLINPCDLHDIIKRSDYSGFRKAQMKQRFERGRLIHDEADFGTRGDNGSGKYLRVYDKTLESNGQKDCVRWEVEFSKERAHIVFDKLSSVKTIDAFATLCGSLIAGAINFVHRTHDKNIRRLDVYDFWQQIKKTLGVLIVRLEIKHSNITGMHNWVFRQVSPTMACLRDTFIDDYDFINWLFYVLDEGELRMSQRQVNIAKANKRTLRFSDGLLSIAG